MKKMKKKLFRQSVIIALMSIPNLAMSQDLSQFNLEAHYELTSDLNDLTSNHDTITILDPVISSGGIYSRGCFFSQSVSADTCNIITPHINAMNNNAFAIQIDFNLSSFNGPIIQAGVFTRYLGLETDPNGVLGLMTGSQSFDNISNVTLQLSNWYNATLIHNTTDSTTNVYIDNQLVFTKHQYLNHPSNENQILNTNFSTSKSFHGYWKDLKVYSTNTPLSIKEQESMNILNLYPNPASSILNVELNKDVIAIDYKIFNVNGKCIKESDLIEDHLDIDVLKPGLYYVTFYQKNKYYGASKFIKE
jgi:hypothetical protein